MPRKDVTRTFYYAQLKQLRYLTTLAAHEAVQGPKFGKRRYNVIVKCHFCGVAAERRGAVAAIEFLCEHNRHSTYVKGALTEGTEPDAS